MLIPADIATCMYYTGLDPITKKPVKSARAVHDRKHQRALMQFFKPENYFLVREALIKAGRADLIGDGFDALIPATPPKAAIQKRRRQANADYHHAVPAEKARPELVPKNWTTDLAIKSAVGGGGRDGAEAEGVQPVVQGGGGVGGGEG